MVSDPIIGPIVSSNLVTQISRTHLRLLFFLVFCMSFSLKMCEHSLMQSFESSRLIHMLISFILRLSFDSCWIVYNSYSRVSGVDMLTTSSRSSLGLNCNVFWVYFEFPRNLRHHEDNTGWRMNSTLLLCFRDPLNLVNAWFKLKKFVNLIAFYCVVCILTTFTNSHVFLEVLLLHAEALRATVVLIHCQNILGK